MSTTQTTMNEIDPSVMQPVSDWVQNAFEEAKEWMAEKNRLRLILAEIADAVAAQRVDGFDRQSWIEARCLEALK